MLELGCGPALFWKLNRERIDPTWSLTLTDFSPGMIEAARAAVGDRAECAVADAQALPYPDASFDVVLASHMLYHVPDRRRALREIARVLVPGGTLHAATTGHDHLRELGELVGPGWGFARHTEDFGLETGRAQLEELFAEVTCELYEDSLEVTEAEPVVAYVCSSTTFAGEPERVRAAVESALAREGVFRIAKSSGVLHALRP